MKRRIKLVGILLLLLVSGCNNSFSFFRSNPDITGYVMDKYDDAILVINTEAKDFSQTGGVEEFYEAVWVSNITESVNLGDQVEVWFEGGVAESYPDQAEMGQLNVIESPVPEGADFSESKALSIALSEEGFETESLAVRSITYDDAEGLWRIELRDVHSYEDYVILVYDEEN